MLYRYMTILYICSKGKLLKGTSGVQSLKMDQKSLYWIDRFYNIIQLSTLHQDPNTKQKEQQIKMTKFLVCLAVIALRSKNTITSFHTLNTIHYNPFQNIQTKTQDCFVFCFEKINVSCFWFLIKLTKFTLLNQTIYNIRQGHSDFDIILNSIFFFFIFYFFFTY